MAWGSNTNPVEIGEATKKVHYDDLWDKLQYIRTDVIPAAAIMLFGQITVQGWTRKSDWQDDSALIYSASGALGSGGSVAASAHTHTGPSHNHQWYEGSGNEDQTYNSGGSAINLPYSAEQPSYVEMLVKIGAVSMSSGNAYALDDGFTDLDGTGASGASTAYYQEVAAFTKDTYT
jgi:hypothetical protein